MQYTHSWKAPEDALFIFTHIPKCAGSTFREHVRSTFGEALLAPYHNPLRAEFMKWGREERLEYRFLSSHNPFGIHRKFDRTPVYLSLTREPLDRFLSFFYFMKNHPKAPHHEQLKNRDLSGALDYFADQQAPLLFNQQCRYLSGGSPTFEAAQLRVDRDYLLVADMTQYEEFVELLVQAQLLNSCEYEVKNVGSRGDKGNPISSDEADRILQANQEDLKLVEYVKESFRELLGVLSTSRVQ